MLVPPKEKYHVNATLLYSIYICFHNCCKTQSYSYTQTTCQQFRSAVYWAQQKPNKDTLITDGL